MSAQARRAIFISTLRKGAAVVVASLPIILVGVWIASLDPVAGFAFDWDDPDITFNWHPFLMVLGYSTFFSYGTRTCLVSPSITMLLTQSTYAHTMPSTQHTNAQHNTLMHT